MPECFNDLRSIVKSADGTTKDVKTVAVKRLERKKKITIDGREKTLNLISNDFLLLFRSAGLPYGVNMRRPNAIV